MARERLSPEALALIYLRQERGWLQKELAAELGHADYRTISRYESGEKALSRESLEQIAARMGYSSEAVDVLLSTNSLIAQPHSEAREESPLALTPSEIQRINRAALGEGWSRAEEVRATLTAWKTSRKVEAGHKAAAELWRQLKQLSPSLRRELVRDSPEYWLWALVLRLCEESVRSAADRPDEALELARLSLLVAERVEGGVDWRNRLQAFAWAHIANALRVGNDFPGADEAFTRAWSLWPVAGDAGPQVVPQWRMLSLEASHRREQARFQEALSLLDRAASMAEGDPAVRGRLLLQKEFVFEEMGDLSRALATLEEAAPLVEASEDRRLLCVLRFETAKALCETGRYAEAAALLPQVRELAAELTNDLDFLRCTWLASRVAAGLGDREEAIAGLEQVRRDFTARNLPYDAARAGLELAVLHLEEGRTLEVKTLAREMMPIFQAQGIARESLAAVSVFLEAAQKETATLELARRALEELKKTRAPYKLRRIQG